MTSVKNIFAIVAASLSVAVTVPLSAIAMEKGHQGPTQAAMQELKQENWEPVIIGVVPLSEGMPPAEEGTIDEALRPANPLVMIFNQKTTDKWRLAVVQGDKFSLQADGDGLNLSPLEDQNAISISYKMQAVPMQHPESAGRCGPADAMHELLQKNGQAARIADGVQSGGQGLMGFYATAVDQGAHWAVTRTDTNNVTCILMMGQGYRLNQERSEFTPLWKQNIAPNATF